MKKYQHYWILAVLLLISYNWYWSYYEKLYETDGYQAMDQYLKGEKSWEEIEHYFSKDVGRSDMRIILECEEGCKKLYIDILEGDNFKREVESCTSSCLKRQIILRTMEKYGLDF